MEMVLNPQVIEDLADGLVDNVLNSLGVMIEGWCGGQYKAAQVSGRGHELKVALVQRRFTDQ